MDTTRSMNQSWIEGVPYWNEEAITKINNIVNCWSKVFEYGTGGSTVWLVRRVAELISVEYEPDWFRIFKNRFKQQFPLATIGEDRISYQSVASLGIIKQIMIVLEELKDCGQNFVDTISLFPDGYFDLVIVDARNRARCLLAASSKVKKDGWILLDDAQRSWYQKGKDALKDWKSTNFKGGRWGREAMLFQRVGV